MSEDFQFLWDNETIITHELHTAYVNAARHGLPLPTALQCAKLFDNHTTELKQKYPQEFEENGKLSWYESDIDYDYIKFIYGWFLPCKETISSILNHCPEDTPILEIGSGPGLFSAILSHFRTVYPTDISKTVYGQTPYFMKPLIYRCQDSIPNNPDSFILSVYPYPDMIKSILDLSKIGQTICIILPPMAGMKREILVNILDQFTLLDKIYSFSGFRYRKKLDWNGIIVRKEKEWEFQGTYGTNSLFDNEFYHSYEDCVKGRLPVRYEDRPIQNHLKSRKSYEKETEKV